MIPTASKRLACPHPLVVESLGGDVLARFSQGSARGNEPALNIRSILFGVLLAAGPIAVLAHGLAGAGSIFTAAVLAVPTALLLLLGDWRAVRPHICDLLFAAFVLLAAASIVVNGAGDMKVVVLLALSLAAYPVARVAGRYLLAPAMFAITAAIVLAGTIATAFALAEQWTWNHGKPMVFGAFDAAPAQFAMLLGIPVLMAATSDKLTSRQRLVVALGAAVPAALFGASLVRFTFVALALALAAAVLLRPAAAGRRSVALLAAIVICASALGFAARSHHAGILLHHLETAADLSPLAPNARLYLPEAADAARCPPIDIDNSIAIRKQLYVDAIAAIPHAGPLGIGLGRFAAQACIKGLSPHNAVLQATIELGWPAGLVLILLLAISLGRQTIAAARMSDEHRFAGCMLVYLALLAIAHGDITGELPLFLLLGYAAALRAARGEILTAWMLRPPLFG